MANSIIPISEISGAAQANQTAPPPAKQDMDKDMFLKLLVAQLKNQDPTSPSSDPTQFLTQTAQFTQLEKLENIANANTDTLALQRMLSGSSMVGKTVTYLNEDGTSGTGVVSSAKIDGATVTLRVGDTDVPLARVSEIKNGT